MRPSIDLAAGRGPAAPDAGGVGVCCQDERQPGDRCPALAGPGCRQRTPTGRTVTASDTDGRLSVSVVICAFTEQRWGDLTAAIEALRGQSRPPDQVVLVIDHNEALLRRARSAWEPGVDILTNQAAPGLSGARNTGVAGATGALIAFLDDDATPEPDWLEHLVAPFADPRVAAVGGAAIPRWENVRPRWWPEEFDWVVGCTYLGMPAAGGEVRNVLGAAMAFRADVFADGERFLDPRWAASAHHLPGARRPSCASGYGNTARTPASCSSRVPWCTTGSLRPASGSATSRGGPLPRAAPRQPSPGLSAPVTRSAPSVPTWRGPCLQAWSTDWSPRSGAGISPALHVQGRSASGCC